MKPIPPASTAKADTRPPFLGFGLGLRPQHYSEILNADGELPIDWFEIISENYMIQGGNPRHMLDRIRERYPVVMHGVSLSIASTQPLDMDYLGDLKRLADEVNPKWISDHLCWTGVHGINLHDLLPVPYTQEALDHVCERVRKVQDFLGRRIAIENVSSYFEYKESEMDEWTFVAELSERADCWLLLDVNNVFVSGQNHSFDDKAFVEAIPRERVVQFHLAGHSEGEDCLIDTHDHPVSEEVFALYEKALRRFGAISTMIERDDNIPPLAELLVELNRARRIAEATLPAASLETAA